MQKDTIPVEIKHISLDVDPEGLGVVELSDLAHSIEEYMKSIQKYEIDTLKQALMAALHFAILAYSRAQQEGGRKKEDEARINDLIIKIKSSLDNSSK